MGGIREEAVGRGNACRGEWREHKLPGLKETRFRRGLWGPGARAEVNVDQPKSSLFSEGEGKRPVWWKGGESWVTGGGRWACSDGVEGAVFAGVGRE